MHSIFRLPDFRRLFAGVTTSQLGDQFALVATPWLVLQLTSDPLTLGLVLALEGFPRAILMLIGGAMTDRFSPRKILLISDIVRFALAGLLGFAVLSGAIELWMVYAFAIGFGLVSGFSIPAGNSIVPMIVDEAELETGNATVMGGGQVVGFLGPVTAGILIGSYAGSLHGVGIALLFDAATFAFSALMMWQMRTGRHQTKTLATHENELLWTSITDAINFVWNQATLRLAFFIIAMVNLLFVGPIMVGIPVLAVQRLAEGAGAFGLLMSGFAGGNLVGYLLAGFLPKPSKTSMRLILSVLLLGFAFVLALLSVVASTWLDFALLFGLGIGNGYATIVLISAIQKNTTKQMMGRIMGLLMFSSMGLVPISQAISGLISRSDVGLLFLVAALPMAGIAVWATMQPALSSIGER